MRSACNGPTASDAPPRGRSRRAGIAKYANKKPVYGRSLSAGASWGCPGSRGPILSASVNSGVDPDYPRAWTTTSCKVSTASIGLKGQRADRDLRAERARESCGNERRNRAGQCESQQQERDAEKDPFRRRGRLRRRACSAGEAVWTVASIMAPTRMRWIDTTASSALREGPSAVRGTRARSTGPAACCPSRRQRSPSEFPWQVSGPGLGRFPARGVKFVH